MANNYFGFALDGTSTSGTPFLFLSCPWGRTVSETTENILQAEAVQKVLTERGYKVLCPLLSHPFGRVPYMTPVTIGRADALVVLNLPGCFECDKVKLDVANAEGIGLPISLVTPGERIAAHLSGELAVEPEVSPLLWQHGGHHREA
jgi:hypothetical protein